MKAFLIILSHLSLFALFSQDYSECLISKSEIIDPELLNAKVQRRIKDLKPKDIILLDDNLIDEGHLIRSPFQGKDSGSLAYLKGKKLTFVEYKNKEIILEDDKRNRHFVYLTGYDRDRTIASSTTLEAAKVKVTINYHFVGVKVVLNDESIYSLFDPIQQSEIGALKYNSERDKFYLLLKKINTDGTKQQGFVGYDISDSRFGLLDYDCFIKKFEKQKTKYLAYLRTNFTEKEIEHIKTSSLFIGMSETAIPHVIGHPSKTNTTVTADGTVKQFIYGDGVFVYITDGKVSAWQNLESLSGIDP